VDLVTSPRILVIGHRIFGMSSQFVVILSTLATIYLGLLLVFWLNYSVERGFYNNLIPDSVYLPTYLTTILMHS